MFVMPRVNRILVWGNLVLAMLAAILASLFAFNWLAPAPDSWPRLHPLYPLGLAMFGLSSAAFLGASRAFAALTPMRWILQAAAIALVAAFYGIRFGCFAN